MILGFAKFSERSRKLIKTLKKQPPNGNEKNMKNQSKTFPKQGQKSLKIHSKINAISKSAQNYFLAPSGRVQMPKSRRIQFFGPFLAPPWILRGPQNHPKSAKSHQHCLIKIVSRRSWHTDPVPRSSLKRSRAPFWLIFT